MSYTINNYTFTVSYSEHIFVRYVEFIEKHRECMNTCDTYRVSSEECKWISYDNKKKEITVEDVKYGVCFTFSGSFHRYYSIIEDIYNIMKELKVIHDKNILEVKKMFDTYYVKCGINTFAFNNKEQMIDGINDFINRDTPFSMKSDSIRDIVLKLEYENYKPMLVFTKYNNIINKFQVTEECLITLIRNIRDQDNKPRNT